jgi:hypothetical protein
VAGMTEGFEPYSSIPQQNFLSGYIRKLWYFPRKIEFFSLFVRCVLRIPQATKQSWEYSACGYIDNNIKYIFIMYTSIHFEWVFFKVTANANYLTNMQVIDAVKKPEIARIIIEGDVQVWIWGGNG